MERKKIKTFSDNIRHMFTRYAIIPVFVIACACLTLFFGIWQYTVYTSNRNANEEISKQIEQTVTEYAYRIDTLSRDASLITKRIHTDRLVEIRRAMYQLTSKTGYSAKLYILNTKLRSVLPDADLVPEFVLDTSCSDWGILHEIQEEPQKLSLQLASGENRILCIGKGIQEKGKLIGYVVATIPAEEFQRLLSRVTPQTMITDGKGWIYLTNNYVFQDSLGRFDRELANTKGYIQYQNRWYYLSHNSILNGMLHVYNFTDHELQSRMFMIMALFVLVIFAAIILMTYLISGKVAKKSTRDIDKIAGAFEQVEQGNLDCYLSISSSVEFKQIGDAYNVMVDGLKKYLKENKELVEHVAFAQVKQLEAQFNPHFLFNTLDNIRFMAKIDSDEADKMIVALSSLLRYSISDASEEIAVEEDMEFTKSYLTILKIRFNKRFTYEISIEDRIKQCRIPKLMMQSLIENAVKYGYGDGETLHVSIRGYEENEKLIFICKDNGAGMDAEVLQRIRDNLRMPVNKSNHHGIYNINRRIQLMYHGDYGVSLTSKKGEGTIVTLTLPVNIKEPAGD
jgi:sensor histidine kinase YesM